MSIKFIPLDRLSAALPIRSTIATINTIGLKRRHPARNLPYASLIASNHGWRISLVFLSVTDAIAGTNVSATTRLAINV